MELSSVGVEKISRTDESTKGIIRVSSPKEDVMSMICGWNSIMFSPRRSRGKSQTSDLVRREYFAALRQSRQTTAYRISPMTVMSPEVTKNAFYSTTRAPSSRSSPPYLHSGIYERHGAELRNYDKTLCHQN